MKLAAAIVALIFATSAMAGELNCSTIRVVVPYPPGGATDVGARLLSEYASVKLGNSFVVENRPGASSNLGTKYVINSAKDGCTLLVNTNVIASFPYSFSNLPFDPLKELSVLSAMGTSPTFIVTANKAISDLNGLQEWSQKKPDGLSYGSSGYGLFAHLAIEEIAMRTQAKYLHVPYRSGGQAAIDMIEGRLDFGSFAAGTVMPFIKQQQIKVVAVIQPNPSLLAPNVKTTSEQNIPNVDARMVFMFFAPTGTSERTLAALSTALNEAEAQPEVGAKLFQLGFEQLQIDQSQGSALMRNTADQWAPVIKRLGIKIE